MQREEWEPQIERFLWEANCGAEKAKWPSGHPEWRIPAENVTMLEPTGQRVTGAGSGYGVPIKAYLYDGIYEMVGAREHFWMPDTITGWAPLQEPKQAQKRKRGKKA